DGDDDLLAVLTRAERLVAEQIAEGRTNAEIAESLILAEGTVKNHVSALLRKLGARDRTGLALALYKTLREETRPSAPTVQARHHRDGHLRGAARQGAHLLLAHVPSARRHRHQVPCGRGVERCHEAHRRAADRGEHGIQRLV